MSVICAHVCVDMFDWCVCVHMCVVYVHRCAYVCVCVWPVSRSQKRMSGSAPSLSLENWSPAEPGVKLEVSKLQLALGSIPHKAETAETADTGRAICLLLLHGC